MCWRFFSDELYAMKNAFDTVKGEDQHLAVYSNVHRNLDNSLKVQYSNVFKLHNMKIVVEELPTNVHTHHVNSFICHVFSCRTYICLSLFSSSLFFFVIFLIITIRISLSLVPIFFHLFHISRIIVVVVVVIDIVVVLNIRRGSHLSKDW